MPHSALQSSLTTVNNNTEFKQQEFKRENMINLGKPLFAVLEDAAWEPVENFCNLLLNFK